MNKDELGRLILEKEKSMWNIAYNMLQNKSDIEDAIGNAIVKAFAGLDSLKEDRYASTWLIRILINECNNIRSSNKKRLQNEDVLDEEMIDEKASGWQDKVEDKIMIEGVLKGLSEEQRSVTLLYYVEEYSVKEIAEILEIPKGTVKSRLKTAREKLKKMLKEQKP